MTLVEFSKRIGIVFGAIIAAATVIGWVYGHTVAPVVKQTQDNTILIAQLQARMDAMEVWKAAHEKRRGR